MLLSELTLGGAFWPVGKEDERLLGVAHFKPLTGLQFDEATTLSGPDSSWDETKNSEEQVTLHGYVSGAKPCSLLGARVKHASNAYSAESPVTVRSRSFYVSMMVLNAHIRSVDEDAFDAIEVEFQGLENWLGVVIIDTKSTDEEKDKFTFTFPFRQQLLMESALDDFTTISLNRHLRATHNMFGGSETSYRSFLEIRTNSKKSISWFMKIVYELQNLLTLILGSAAYPQSIEGIQNHESGVKRSDIVFQLREPFAEEPERERMIMCAELIADLGKILKTHHELNRDLKRAEELLLGTFYSTKTFVQSEFLSLAQSLESFHRATNQSTVVPSTVFKPLCDVVTQKIKELDAGSDITERMLDSIRFANQTSLQQRIDQLLQTLAPATIKDLIGDKEVFSKTLKQTRNYLTHPGIDKQSLVLDGVEQFFRFNQRLKALLRFLFLVELGFSEEKASDVAKGHIWV